MYTFSLSQKQKDSVSFRYKFSQNDSLLYKVISNDSISFQGKVPLIKERNELYLIICDSVGENGHYFLTQVLIKSVSKESSGEVRDLLRSESSWIGRKIYFEIDSVGNRYSFGAEDSLKADVSPGGAFQPNLFFPFKESLMRIGESWIVETLDDLPENCIPPPLRKQTSIFRALPSLDTLGASCNQFQYTMTGQGSVQLRYSNGQMLRTNSIIAQFGKMEINTDYFIPHHFYATAEVKLTLKLPDGKELKGIHLLSSNYFLIEVHSKRPKNSYDKKEINPKNSLNPKLNRKPSKK